MENIIFQPHCQGRHDNLLEGDWEPKSCNESLGQPEFLTIYPHFFGAYLIPVTLVGKSHKWIYSIHEWVIVTSYNNLELKTIVIHLVNPIYPPSQNQRKVRSQGERHELLAGHLLRPWEQLHHLAKRLQHERHERLQRGCPHGANEKVKCPSASHHGKDDHASEILCDHGEITSRLFSSMGNGRGSDPFRGHCDHEFGLVIGILPFWWFLNRLNHPQSWSLWHWSTSYGPWCQILDVLPPSVGRCPASRPLQSWAAAKSLSSPSSAGGDEILGCVMGYPGWW